MPMQHFRVHTTSFTPHPFLDPHPSLSVFLLLFFCLSPAISFFKQCLLREKLCNEQRRGGLCVCVCERGVVSKKKRRRVLGGWTVVVIHHLQEHICHELFTHSLSCHACHPPTPPNISRLCYHLSLLAHRGAQQKDVSWLLIPSSLPSICGARTMTCLLIAAHCFGRRNGTSRPQTFEDQRVNTAET